MPRTSLKVLCKFSNDLKYQSGECWVLGVSRNCVLITNALDRVIIFQRRSSREKLASPRNHDILLRACLIERVISARVAATLKAERISTLDIIARRKATVNFILQRKCFKARILRLLSYHIAFKKIILYKKRCSILFR